MENKVASGAIGMRPCATLRRPSIFKSLSLAKRAGGRRVFLSRRKITHCPLSVVLRSPSRPSSLFLLSATVHSSLVHSSWSGDVRRLSFHLFGSSPSFLFSPVSVPFFVPPVRSVANERRRNENVGGRESIFEKKKRERERAIRIIIANLFFQNFIVILH